LARHNPTKLLYAVPTCHEINHPGVPQLHQPRQSAQRTMRHVPPSVSTRPLKPRSLPSPKSKNMN
jgi:hypothetical protein